MLAGEEQTLFGRERGLPYMRPIYVLSVRLMHSQIEGVAADFLEWIAVFCFKHTSLPGERAASENYCLQTLELAF